MTERREYEVSPEDWDAILAACRPVPYLVMNGVATSSPQERANAAWRDLGRRMGFDGMTAEAAPRGGRWITAIPSEPAGPSTDPADR